MANVAMPRLSDSMEEGTIIKWLKSDGDEIALGDELVEIETDKANMTYESDLEGTLAIVAQEGDTLAVGETIASIGGGDAGGSGDGGGGAAQPTEQSSQASGAAREPGRGAEDAAAEADAAHEEAAAEREPATATATATATQAQPAEEDAGTNGSGDRVKASPVARRMARELGVELGGLHGTGPGGRIVKADVQAAADGSATQAEPAAAPAAREAAPAQPEAQPERGTAVPAPVVSGGEQTGRGETTVQDLSRLQQTIARRMAESKATAPEFVLTAEVDMEEAVALRTQLKAAAGDGPVPSYNDLVIKACALALREFPRANGAYRDGKWELYSRVNIGIAVAAEGALVVPTVFDAAEKSIGTIAREARALAERVRAGAITPPELSAGTFTISNLGMFGIRQFTAVINPPQAAILAVGEMSPRPVVRDGEIVARNLMMLTLSCDHRILYGADAAEFLGRVRERLERPMSLLL